MPMDIEQEIRELKDMVSGIGKMVLTIRDSLKRCQSRCHVDNPPGRWRCLGRALRALVAGAEPSSSRTDAAAGTDN